MSKEKKKIFDELLAYLKMGNPLIANLKKVPLNESLVELGYLDSFGIIDLVEFLEKSQKVKILDDEITKEKFGSINKMVDMVYKKKYLDNMGNLNFKEVEDIGE